MRKSSRLLIMIWAVCLVETSGARGQDASRYPIIPWPQHVEARPGEFVLNEHTRLVLSEPSSAELQRIAGFLAEMVRLSSGLPLSIGTEASASFGTPVISLVLDEARSGGGAESYALSVSPAGIIISAAAPKALFYGVQTLRQLMPVTVERGGKAGEVETWTIPAVEIEDAPRFSYRGMHLDVGRHFFPVEFIKKYIDLLALYKMNTFHWHLTEDQGWRIEIKQYPRLAEVGGCRKETLVGHYSNQPHQFDGERYCGYYTQNEIRDVVAHAQARYVTIIPEIEMPGHSQAALAAYPELACTEGPFEAATLWGVFEDVYCPKEETFTFLEDVLDEVMVLFPGKYVHIGGDEAPKDRWRESPVAQEVIRREGLKDEHELQSYFIRRIETYLNAHGRQLIGWDEILEGGLAPQATVMSWRGTQGGIEAARQGHDVIMTPNDDLYFDHYQADPSAEPLAIGGLTTLEDVYRYEPIPAELTPEQSRHVLGAQANVWTEYMPTSQKVEYMVFPRMLALSEVVWSPESARDWEHFSPRLRTNLQRLDVMNVNYRKPETLRALE